MRQSRLKRLQHLVSIVLRLARIAMAAVVIVAATAESSATFGVTATQTTITASDEMQLCGGALDCKALACSAVSCLSFIAIESRGFVFTAHRQGSFQLPLSGQVPSLPTSPQPHPPRI